MYTKKVYFHSGAFIFCVLFAFFFRGYICNREIAAVKKEVGADFAPFEVESAIMYFRSGYFRSGFFDRFKVDILDYMVTSNHVHLLLAAKHGDEISKALQFLHGSVGQKYNILKNRQGAFWSDRFHSTRIQSGDHLSRCLFYIDLNMIRAGAVEQPEEWQHCGIHELLGKRERYCLVNMERLLKCLAINSINEFQKWYKSTLSEKLACISHERQAYWSEAIAVGNPDWLQSSALKVGIKRFSIKKMANMDKKSYIHFLMGKN